MDNLLFIADWENQIRWLAFKNDSGEAIPAFAIMEVNDVASDGTPSCRKPSKDSAKLTMINGPVKVPKDYKGRGTRETPMWILFDVSDGLPSTDERWGTKADSWMLSKGKQGFLTVAMQGSAEPPVAGIVFADREECLP